MAEALPARLDPREGEVQRPWDEELRRRIDDVERDAVELTPAELAFAEVSRAIAR